MARHFIYLGLLVTSYIVANPTGPVVQSGSAATISGVGTSTVTIQSTTQTTQINWNTFSIANGETVRFQYAQPSGNYYVLNTVVGGSASAINGILQTMGNANGNIYLINPSGITIGSTGQVIAGAFLASTLQLVGTFNPTLPMQFQGTSQNGVTNSGTVTSSSGDVTFIGYQIANSGTVNACDTAVFGAGYNLLLQPGNSDRVLILTNTGTTGTGPGISSTGTINAESVYLKADGNLYTLAINHTGTINITACVGGSDGTVTIIGDRTNGCSGAVEISGTIVTSSNIFIDGETIALEADSILNSSGTTGAGSITVGTLTGVCPTTNIYVDTEAQILANASVSGSGGAITMRANNSLLFLGTLQATGISSGGSASLTSNDYLGVNGTVALTSTSGVFGTLSLTNSDFIVGGTANYGSNYAPPEYSPGIVDSMITTTALVNALTNGKVTIVAEGIYPAESTITVSDNFTWTTGTTLTLTAGDTIQVNAKGTMTNTTIAATSPVVVLNAPNINIGMSAWPSSMTPVPTGFNISSGAINVAFGEVLNLYGGTSSNTVASLKGTNIVIDSTVSGIGNILLSGSGCSGANIDGSSILIGDTITPNSLTILGGNCSSNNESYVGSLTVGSTIVIDLTGDVALVGGTTGTLNRASIISSGGSSSAITISAYDINLTGGSSGNSLNEARIAAYGTTGNVSLTTVRDLYITGGSSPNGSAYVTGENTTVNVGRDLIVTGGTALSSSGYIHGISSVTGDVFRFLILQGGSAQSADALISTYAGDITLGASSNEAQFIFSGGNIANATNGSARLHVTTDGNILIGQSNNAPYYVNLIAGYGAISAANPSAAFTIEGDGDITVTTLSDVNYLGGSGGGVNTFAASRINGTGDITYTTGRDMNIKTGNTLYADVYLHTENGLISINTNRDFNMTGSCSVPNTAYLAANGDLGAVSLIVGRDFTMTEKSEITIDNPTVSTPSQALLIAVGNTWTHIGCPFIRFNEIVILPAPTVVPVVIETNYPAIAYYKYTFLYELFYRLNYFGLYDWFEYNGPFWNSTTYTDPGN